MLARMTKRVAVDIGGTFTDLAAVDGSGRLTLAKTDTTPSSPDRGAVHALKQSGLAPADITTFVHGTTVVINAVTERKGATTALLTTEGFRDVLEIGRANRPDLYNLAYRKPPPFVPRRRRFEVRERRITAAASSSHWTRARCWRSPSGSEHPVPTAQQGFLVPPGGIEPATRV
jgi:N-methylhydantoinase A/oxoprolinase/acetone carboxylase beta subunit